MELDVTEEDMIDDADDPASKAFRKLKREVGMMRLAVEKLADEPAKIEIPDYTETLTEMAARISSMSGSLKALQSSPALEMTPDAMARQIVAARKETQAAERGSLDEATAALDSATRIINEYVESARSADRQNKWVLGFGALAFVVGVAVTSAFFLW